MKKVRLAILASGSGSNAEAIMSWAKFRLDTEVVCLISDKKKAYALERSLKYNVKSLYVKKEKNLSMLDYDKKLIKELNEFKPDYILLAGYMRLLSGAFLDTYPKRVINIHPSLLPKYPGMSGYEEAFKSNDEEFGCTIHFVDEGMDTGEIIIQEKLKRIKDESFEEFKSRGLKLENSLYPKVIEELVKKFFKEEAL